MEDKKLNWCCGGMKVNNMHDFVKKNTTNAAFAGFCNNSFCFFFTILRGKVSCNLSITDAKPKQMKLTEHSCCFDNEDDGNFFPERRETL